MCDVICKENVALEAFKDKGSRKSTNRKGRNAKIYILYIYIYIYNYDIDVSNIKIHVIIDVYPMKYYWLSLSKADETPLLTGQTVVSCVVFPN